MVDKIVVNPESIRGLGNIIEGGKNPSEYITYYGSVSESSVDIDGITRGVFGCEFNPETIGVFTINSNGHLIFTIESNANVTFSINNNGHLIVTGDNEARYSINNEGHCIYGG